ncbi:MAG TPA: DinB family protein [Terriglobales bacterium]|nr:DinB family protein [Terriglobales bacterium]
MAEIAALPFDKLIEYEEEEAQKWEKWLRTQPPKALEVPVGTGDTATVRGLIWHICAVEYRHAQRLLGEPPASPEELRRESLDDIFRLGDTARMKMTSFLAGATDAVLNETITFETRTAGTFTSSRRKLLTHILLHGIRHWAQIATALRQAGYKQDWQHDFLMTEVMK